MALSLYDLSIPALTRGLTNMSTLLDKASAHAENKKFDTLAFVQARLFPDMHPLSRQVQFACDTAKGAGARLAQVDLPQHPDTETTFRELQERIAKTGDFLRTLAPGQFHGAESREIELKFPNGSHKFTGLSYLTEFVLPNFYFHVSMVYALLRTNGVDVGKRDFLGNILR